jgi:hypothetical protein
MSMFKQKLSIRTQIQMAELLSDVKAAAADAEPDGVANWTGEFVLWYDDRQRFPRLAIYVDHSVPGTGFGQWWTRLDDQLVSDESIDFLMRG